MMLSILGHRGYILLFNIFWILFEIRTGNTIAVANFLSSGFLEAPNPNPNPNSGAVRISNKTLSFRKSSKKCY